MKIVVSASAGDIALIDVHYHAGKPFSFKGKVDTSDNYAKAWTVSKSAPLGKASARVSIVGTDKTIPSPDPFVIGFTVTK